MNSKECFCHFYHSPKFSLDWSLLGSWTPGHPYFSSVRRPGRSGSHGRRSPCGHRPRLSFCGFAGWHCRRLVLGYSNQKPWHHLPTYSYSPRRPPQRAYLTFPSFPFYPFCLFCLFSSFSSFYRRFRWVTTHSTVYVHSTVAIPPRKTAYLSPLYQSRCRPVLEPMYFHAQENLVHFAHQSWPLLRRFGRGCRRRVYCSMDS